MIWCLAVILLSQISLEVLAGELSRLRAAVDEKKQYIKLLTRENAILEEKIKAAEVQCDSELGPLKVESENYMEELLTGSAKMVGLQSDITRTTQELELLADALDVEHKVEADYLEQLDKYKKDSGKFRDLKPMFPKYRERNSFSRRSSARDNNGVPQPRMFTLLIKLLQDELDSLEKRERVLKDINMGLKQTLETNPRSCEERKKEIQGDIEHNKGLLQTQLKQLNKYAKDLNSLKEDIKKIKVEIRQMKEINEELKRKLEEKRRENSGYTDDRWFYDTVPGFPM